SAARHTYDVGYKKWEDFDVNAALLSDGEDEPAASASVSPPPPPPASNTPTARAAATGVSPPRGSDAAAAVPKTVLTPATIAVGYAPHTSPAPVPAALGIAKAVDLEAAERERGNAFFQRGEWALAAKSYTRCLGLKSGNAVAFSNRAIAFLKLK
ncbi:unnamed protein product, partial [Phaeothamnion confervicola]